jgi:hypothetical protein
MGIMVIATVIAMVIVTVMVTVTEAAAVIAIGDYQNKSRKVYY